MRSLLRTIDRRLARDVAALAAAVALVGASFGAIAVDAGNPVWVPVVMSLVVFAGGAQFMAIGVVASGGGLLAAVLGALLLNLRMFPFGMAVGDVLGRSWPARLVGAHLLADETVAFALARRDDPARGRAAYWASGVALYVGWNLGVLVGALVSSTIGDTDALGIDAAFPAALLALMLPSLREPDVRQAALAGAVIAVAATPFVPPGIPVLLALLGVGVALLPVPRMKKKGARA